MTRWRIGLDLDKGNAVTSPDLNRVLEQNIRTMREQRQKNRERCGWPERIAGAVAAYAGSIPFVYLHVLIVVIWILVNLGWTPLARFDPTFVILASAASVEAIFLSAFILISQTRMTREADERADLILQITLLSEHEVTRLIQLTSSICEHFKIGQTDDPHLEELKRDVSPEKVVEKINEEI